MNSETSLATVDGRCSANYCPNIWDGDRIQSLRSNYTDLQSGRHEELKQVVGRMLYIATEPLDLLALIDDIQRLGVAYHFEKQINDALDGLYSSNKVELAAENNLLTASLYFRLLRQHGFYISADIFMKFKDGEGGFKASLCEDADGLLSLYEASYLGITGEIILYEAKVFSASNLKKLVGNVGVGMARRIAHALDLPLHWRMVRVEARHYIDVYEENENGRNDDLLEFAKLDFNFVQSVHQKDLKDLSIWWDSIDIARKLEFTRNRLMESFQLSVGVVFEPKFSECRKAITKDIALITIIDDIYDVYGSLEELELFTDAIIRWDLGVTDQLPEYMKLCYLALFNTTNEIVYATLKETGQNVLSHLKKLWAMQCNTYLVEAQWFHKGYTPTLEEYLNNAIVSIGCPLVLAHTYTFTQQGMTRMELDHIVKDLKLISWSSLIFRLFDDLGTSKAEQQRGDVSKSTHCYMHEAGVSEEIAEEHVKDLINDAWKGLNEESLKASTFSRSFVNAIINGARAGVCTYRHGDGYGSPDNEAKGRAMALFLEPVPPKGHTDSV